MLMIINDFVNSIRNDRIIDKVCFEELGINIVQDYRTLYNPPIKGGGGEG